MTVVIREGPWPIYLIYNLGRQLEPGWIMPGEARVVELGVLKANAVIFPTKPVLKGLTFVSIC